MAIGELLREQDIALDITARGKRSTLARIAARFSEKVPVGECAVLAALLHRERLGTTGIGHGVAIPHARLDGLSEPAAMLALLERPVWFDSPDNEPVDLLWTLLWPKADSCGFLPALASICRLLRSAELRGQLRTSESPAEATAWIALYDKQIRPRERHENPIAGTGQGRRPLVAARS